MSEVMLDSGSVSWHSRDMAQIAERIRSTRRAKGMTIERLAFTAGVSVSTVNRAEGGETPSLKSLMAIAQGLDVPVSDLIDGKQERAS